MSEQRDVTGQRAGERGAVKFVGFPGCLVVSLVVSVVATVLVNVLIRLFN